jgi:hypothetical protein
MREPTGMVMLGQEGQFTNMRFLIRRELGFGLGANHRRKAFTADRIASPVFVSPMCVGWGIVIFTPSVRCVCRVAPKPGMPSRPDH